MSLLPFEALVEALFCLPSIRSLPMIPSLRPDSFGSACPAARPTACRIKNLGTKIGMCIFWAMLFGLAHQACRDDPTTFAPQASYACTDNEGIRPTEEQTGCQAGLRYAGGRCVAEDCRAQDGAGCCPGQVCSGNGVCVTSETLFSSCQDDNDCRDGKKCRTRPELREEGKICVFATPDANQTCPSGGIAWEGRCIEGLPCGGPCFGNRVCNIETSLCEPAPKLGDAIEGCDQTCGPESILIYEDPEQMLFERCCAVRCVCATLPGVDGGLWGRFAAMTEHNDTLWMSTYSATYGDLVVAQFDTEGQEQNRTHIDGVPSDAPPTRDPEGLRGGQTGAGVDVGWGTSIDANDTGLYVAYHDLDNAQLKWAQRSWSNNAPWTHTIVDAGMGLDDSLDDSLDSEIHSSIDVGQHPKLVLTPTAGVAIAYLNLGYTPQTGAYSGLRLAHASTQTPKEPADWQFTDLPTWMGCNPPCDPEGADPTHCIASNNGPQCLPLLPSPNNTCNGGCGCQEVCTPQGCKPALATSPISPVCGISCDLDAICIIDDAGSSRCVEPREDCALASEEQEQSQEQSPEQSQTPCETGTSCGRLTPSEEPQCWPLAQRRDVFGLPEARGLFADMVWDDTANIVYHDHATGTLRLAQQALGDDESSTVTESTFTDSIIACNDGIEALPLGDVGQHASLARNPITGFLGTAYQGSAGTTLWFREGADLATATPEPVDLGDRNSAVHWVGAYAQLAFSQAGEPVIAYADQNTNDVLLAWKHQGSWLRTTLAQEGAVGRFLSLILKGTQGWVSTYLDGQDPQGSRIGYPQVIPFQLDPNAF